MVEFLVNYVACGIVFAALCLVLPGPPLPRKSAGFMFVLIVGLVASWPVGVGYIVWHAFRN